jgi:hypothetical protein
MCKADSLWSSRRSLAGTVLLLAITGPAGPGTCCNELRNKKARLGLPIYPQISICCLVLRILVPVLCCAVAIIVVAIVNLHLIPDFLPSRVKAGRFPSFPAIVATPPCNTDETSNRQQELGSFHPTTFIRNPRQAIAAILLFLHGRACPCQSKDEL